MTAHSSLLRPRDTDALRAALRQVALQGSVPVLFGGEVQGDSLLVSELVGTRTGVLRGLVVRSRSGLGGASMVAGRPLSVADYHSAASITHDYDTPVLSEGIRSVLAVPVLVDGMPRAILYGAYRTAAPFGGSIADLMVDSARRLGQELQIRDEVDRRLLMQQSQLVDSGEAGVDVEGVREVHAELRRLAADPEPATGGQLRLLADELLRALAREAPASTGPLTGREIDVLAQVALGCTNKQVAERLSLRPETVKGYLRGAAVKLGTHTRHEAVSRARRLGLIP
ncbi:LuxR C-terminal-related transcriptional regulator [Rhodococcus sp. NPDC127530]|uniref:helix-turn-helix transcriptional regulator n=1 Tax=unclassified Rhodococcus (in: high G+C Gram-positive bacteria) TaxID=192944 RepID=UPI00362875CE